MLLHLGMRIAMKKSRIFNKTKVCNISLQAEFADTFLSRLIGLLGRTTVGEEEGIILSPCNSIHTIGMRFPIDAIFLDQNNKVCHLIINMNRFKISPIVKNASKVIEIQSGKIKKLNVQMNDELEFYDC